MQVSGSLSQSAAGLDPAKALTQYAHGSWHVADGLPQDNVVSIAQTPDGYLWLGTEEGLVRFDGLRFTVFDRSNTPELKSNDIYALLVDRTGNLWIGTGGRRRPADDPGEVRRLHHPERAFQ